MLELRHREGEERAKNMSLAEFTRQAWPIIEPGTPLVWGRHIDAVCLHLEAVADGRIRKLIINIPPGHMKSVLVSVMFPAWMWARNPHVRCLTGAYVDDLATRDAVKSRDILSSDWFQETFCPRWRWKRDENLKTSYKNTAMGARATFSIGGQLTGFRGDGTIVDDPLNVRDAMSEMKRKEAVMVMKTALPTRVNQPKTAWHVLIMQRLHEEDPTGVLLKDGSWEHLCLPAEFEPSRRCTTSIGWTDWRTEEGELLFPEMFGRAELADFAKTLGPAQYAGQFLQRPVPASGLVFQRDWFRLYDVAPARFDEIIISVDAAFKKTEETDFVVIGALGRLGSDFYLLDLVRDRLDYISTKDAIRAVIRRWPTAYKRLVEDKANGSAIINELNREFGGFIGVSPTDSKLARARAVSGHVRSGNVWLPLSARWLEDFLHEMCHFPLGAKDDQVDMFTQALLYWLEEKSGYSMLDLTS